MSRRKRHELKQIRSVRERLTSSSGLERAFDFELLRTFATQRSSAALTMILLAGMLAVLSSAWIAAPQAFLWLSFMCTSMAVSLSTGRSFLNTPETDVSIRTWRRKFIIAELLQGFCWGVFIAMLLVVSSDNSKIFIFFAVLVVSAATAMVSAPIPATVYAGLAPMGLAMLYMAYPLKDMRDIVLVGATLSAQGYFVLLTIRQFKSLVATLSFQAEKDALIAELEQAKLNSDEARRRAEESNIAKSQFLATMSHELRTPLNAILGFSEVIKGELLGPLNIPAYKEYVSDIHNSGQHLLNLINEILDLSRVEAGRYELKEESISLAGVAEDCQHMLALRAKNRSVAVRLSAEPHLPKLWADERAIRQIVLNVLSNAIKFTPQGGEVDIKVGWTSSGGQYVSIKDTGPGIPEDEIPIVLSSFGRGSAAIKSAEEGTGLGLPIVKGLVDLHGGNFTLRSKLREGTEVIVTLPPQRVMEALAAMPRPGDKVTGRRAA
ncbi:MAG: sensor histidine kinase [Beijerinckiaceae bacterium]